MNEPLLSLQSVSRTFAVSSGLFGSVVGHVHAVNTVSLEVAPGEIVGLVGESGCGKSTLGRLMVRLLKLQSGRILFNGKPLAQTPPGRLQMIFQDPFSSLNPRLPVGVSIAEPLRALGVKKQERQHKVHELLDLVGLDAEHARRFPHEFSGGQRQRIAIARALITRPDLIVCDEAVSALDASIQAQVLNLLADMRERFGLTYIFISHDLDVVGHMSDRIAVMYLGHIVELAPRDALLDTPMHPYTATLLAAAPTRDSSRRNREKPLVGEPPSPLAPPAGCAFHPRCSRAMDICRQTLPSMTIVQTEQTGQAGHAVRCHLYS